ncbi:hypothetical protein D3C85_1517620 [compost metagenome]
MTVIEQKLLSVKIVVLQTINGTYISKITCNFILQLNIRDQAVVPIINRYLQFINGISACMI